ncbi:hypothetical protein [Aurantiacibacter marinus]|uniref:Uncharacterized protein n=1 Tax=Aurantiacibacter marinus TaxID=874156 RepID=A0A0H0XNG5_9SPHN|nr:hypothetical protein [Aurantiacibacter marinus]KLI64163.1 hypothetical protein AAV99_00320 [Aurantiacibacter marinus]
MGELVVIFTFILLAASLVFAMGQKFHQRAVDHEQRKLELELQIEQAKKGQAGARNQDFQQMEDRLRVLERIATDPSADISRQIENLREIKVDGEKVA